VSDNAIVFNGTLARGGSIWDKWYWQGDFTPLETPGGYYISATVGSETASSFDFSIGTDVLAAETGALVYQYLWTQRCGTAVAGWHGVCHADDGLRNDNLQHVDAVGGWHDSGDYNKFTHGFTADPVLGLLWLYESDPDRFDAMDADGNSIADVLDEALYGARWLAKMTQPSGHILKETQKRRSGPSWVRPENDTNGTVGDGDDRWIEPGDENTPQEMTVCAALIRLHRVLASKGLPTESFRDKAVAIWNHRVAIADAEGGHNNLGATYAQVFAGLDLYAELGDPDHRTRALQRVDERANSLSANPSQLDGMQLPRTSAPSWHAGLVARQRASAYPAAKPARRLRR
jgi:hypothetical protein